MAAATILIVTTQTWLQVTRLALRFRSYGANVIAACPASSELSYCELICASYLLRTLDPVASLRNACLKGKPDYLVPADDRAVWLLHELGRRYTTHQALVERSLGPSWSYPIVRSRAKLLQLAASHGIATAATRAIENKFELEAYTKRALVPFFLKKDGTWGGGGVRLVDSVESAAAAYHHLSRKLRFKDKLRQRTKDRDATAFARLHDLGIDEISAQIYVEGIAANAMYACYEGVVLGEVHAQVVSAKGETGAALMIMLIKDQRMSEAGARLASVLGLTGFFGLDFIVERSTGIPVLIEMNPRCTQLGHVAIPNELDLAGILWQRWTGSNAPQPGSSTLSPFISFFPQASERDPNSFFLKQSRPDVCPVDLPIVMHLSKGNPSKSATLRRGAGRWLRRLRDQDQAGTAAPGGAKIHYFLDEAALADWSSSCAPGSPASVSAKGRSCGNSTHDAPAAATSKTGSNTFGFHDNPRTFSV